MALYIGSSKKKLSLGKTIQSLKIYTIGSKIVSSDNYVLKDKNDVFITAKDGENYGGRI